MAAKSKNADYQHKSKLDEHQVQLAVPALFKLLQLNEVKAKKRKLMADDEKIWLNLILKKIPNPTKPIQISLPHSLHPTGTLEICLFCKDNEKDTIKKKLEKDGITEIVKIISIIKLKKNYRGYEAKRQLCQMYDLFLADDRIYHLLPPYLGKKFFEKKKYPIPVSVTKKNLTSQINGIRNSTYFSLGKGKCNAIPVAMTNLDSEKITENIIATVNSIAAKIPRGWKNIQALYIKTTATVALPIYNSIPYESTKINTDNTTKTVKVSLAD
ncbi:uncharacterized protein TRIADDRAFT_53766 [Trichoplax adhaerens]|uniref:Ribosomal L1 domain-containing protein 1 n=1 Tax=Trichoplax adhaerens TaxID=10228 RepID=B3RQ39_TRIAD|nr:hypothetical protein TRIADDRAFT_53766 [Trichoplax adhaerens]EDV27752.1 hypothetical protein TRIADDRAFT_53766 [Trichoplax adhaerens]|eukprot:XP_002109586.1 hypothetical protein TRIADDRAFT_53766 [Trichoplax adhaerens]